MSKNNNSNGGIEFINLIAVAFIVLKLVKFEGNSVNDWSWWWVLSPIWISFLVFLLILLCYIIYKVIAEIRSK